ncbi:MAG: hypothetical protein Q8O53_02855 [Candidatus Moranbacteria bacterium]|nr:hypothetical protein [Candidatus Moranbacteria bacterium]
MAVVSKKIVVISVLALASVVVLWQAVSRSADDVAPVATREAVLEESVVPLAMKVGARKISTKTRYDNPAGGDEVGFTLTVDEEGAITDVVVDVLATNPTSRMRQQAFASELPQALKGKKLRDLEAIDKIGGSSLTTKAFNEALPEMKSQL